MTNNMKGRKVGILIGALAVLASMLAMNASAAISHEVECTPSSVKWDQHLLISMWVKPNSTGTWVGTAYCNLTSPSGDIYRLGGLALTVASDETTDYANWTYDPSEAGSWTVNIDMVKASGTLTIADHTTTFTVERSGVWLNRTVQDWVGLIWMLFVIIAILLLLVVIVNRTNRDAGGSP